MTVPSRIFAVGALALLVWTAVLELALPGAPVTSRPRSAAPVLSEPIRSRSFAPRGRPGPTGPASPRASANDAGDPTAAGPPEVEDPAVTRLVQRWCAAFGRWGLGRLGGWARVLRALSTPALYASFAGKPSMMASRPAHASFVSSVQTFRAPHGYTATVELRAGGGALELDLIISATAHGLRVSALYI